MGKWSMSEMIYGSLARSRTEAPGRREEGVNRIVSISEMYISSRSDDILITHSLGSCIGLALYDPESKVGGLLHAMMPLSRMDPERALNHPCVFVDTGVTALLRAVFNRGATRKNLVAKMAGGAVQLGTGADFKIGERNYAVARKVLWKNDILIDLLRFNLTVIGLYSLYISKYGAFREEDLKKKKLESHGILKTVFAAINTTGRLLDRVEWKKGEDTPALEKVVAEIVAKRKEKE